LERAVAALQAQAAPDAAAPAAAAPAAAAPAAAAEATAADRVLWALEGLRARAPEGGAVLYTGTVDLPTGGTVQWQYGLATAAVFAQDWSERAGALTALGHAVRLQMLHAVLNGTTTASELVETLGLGTSGQLYHHLKELTAAGWLVSSKRGAYEVPAARIVPLLAILVAAGTPG
ncbi:MAG: winged helix-turn-helix domain-containing protein, partial [Microbacterium sp.]